MFYKLTLVCFLFPKLKVTTKYWIYTVFDHFYVEI